MGNYSEASVKKINNEDNIIFETIKTIQNIMDFKVKKIPELRRRKLQKNDNHIDYKSMAKYTDEALNLYFIEYRLLQYISTTGIDEIIKRHFQLVKTAEKYFIKCYNEEHDYYIYEPTEK